MHNNFIQNYIDCIRNKKYKKMLETINWLEENMGITSPIFDKIKNHNTNWLCPFKQYKNLKKELQNYLNTIDATKMPKATGELREHQLKLLQFAKKLIPVIEKEGLHPLLTGGCLIGAVRHSGFVPWDDDLDFDLMRDEFIALKEIIKSKFHFIDRDSVAGFDELYDKINKYWEQNPMQIIFAEKPSCISAWLGTKLNNCVVIDFFPRDYLNETITKEQYLDYRNQNHNKFKKETNWIKKFAFMEKQLNNSAIYSKESRLTAYGWGNTSFNDFGKVSYVDIDTIKPYKRIKFEDTEFYTINDIKKYLSDFYGDYMSIPSEMEITKYIKDFSEIS